MIFLIIWNRTNNEERKKKLAGKSQVGVASQFFLSKGFLKLPKNRHKITIIIKNSTSYWKFVVYSLLRLEIAGPKGEPW